MLEFCFAVGPVVVEFYPPVGPYMLFYYAFHPGWSCLLFFSVDAKTVEVDQ